MTDQSRLLSALTDHVVGRTRELELVVAALAANRHVLLEGPPGTGKSQWYGTVSINTNSTATGFEMRTCQHRKLIEL